MKEHFQQSKHFRNILPNIILPEPRFSQLQNGFVSLGLSFLSVKWGKVTPVHMESIRMNCDNVPVQPIVGA